MTKIEDFWIPIRRDEDGLINCPLPEDGQEVLVSTDCGVELDTFGIDGDGSFYFEDNFIEDVNAWMPLPEAYK